MVLICFKLFTTIWYLSNLFSTLPLINNKSPFLIKGASSYILGNKNSIFYAKYPECDESALVLDEIEVAVQINSKMRTKIMIPNEVTEDLVKEIIFKDEKLSTELNGKTIKKLIIVPKRLINIII